MPDPIGSPPPVVLRAVTESDLRWLAEVGADPSLTGEHNWPDGPRDVDTLEAELRAEHAAGALDGEGSGTMLVCLPDGTRIGDVSWRTERWGPQERSRCRAIGINLVPEHRGRGLGTAAQRLLVDHLFRRDPDLHRIQSDTAVDNPAERRALRRAGFREEGVVRRAELRHGRYHDHVVFGILRSEWELGPPAASGPSLAALELIRAHGLGPHPEGGWYRRTYEAPARVPGSDRPLSTAILYLLADGHCSHLHRIDADELWHWHRGDPLDVIELRPGAPAAVTRISADHPQHVVAAGTWFGASLPAGADHALVGCTVSPGFEFAGFELGNRAELQGAFPHDAALIQQLTPG